MIRLRALPTLMFKVALCSGMVLRVFAGDDHLQIDAEPLPQRATALGDTSLAATLDSIRRTNQLPTLGVYFRARSQAEQIIATGYRQEGDPTPVTNTAHERVWHALNQALLLSIPRAQGDNARPAAPNQ